MDESTHTEQGCYTQHGVSGYGVAIKLTSRQPMDGASVRAMAEEMMRNVARNCVRRGARCIGHIKAHVKTESGTIKADTLGEAHGTFSDGSLASPVTDLYMAVNSIVQGIHQDLVREATMDGIHQIADRIGLAVVKEKEHAYFDEFDFIVSKEKY
ncbi:MAG: hypothetical protein FJY85_11145, partial [Deltaproteobacteria bacterium]|nr:hypothetical protein [Deltaproteobacteria bacterium]